MITFDYIGKGASQKPTSDYVIFDQPPTVEGGYLGLSGTFQI